MSTIKMTKGFAPIAPTKIAQFEHSQGMSFPDDYRRFLLQYNGGRPEKSHFKFHGSDNGSNVHTLSELKRAIYVGGEKDECKE